MWLCDRKFAQSQKLPGYTATLEHGGLGRETRRGGDPMNQIGTSNDVRLILPFVSAPAPTDGGRIPVGNATTYGDRVEVSAAGAALAGLEESDEMRFEKVARVRGDIQSGTYDVEGKLEQVLDRILDDVLA
jgi:anti-sigma28 factor (negative regulator of flagellin synthesis)